MSKSVEELFKDAPPEATHYCSGAISGFWRDLSGATWKFFRDSDSTWHDSGDRTSGLIHNGIGLKLIERPQPKPWSGPEDGLPPVNERVEVLWSSITGEYVDALILAHDEDRAVFRFITGDRKGEYQADKLHFSAKFPNFRAIKTPDQIAAEKRENAIREFMDVVGIDCRVTASRAVDAGFKREVV